MDNLLRNSDIAKELGISPQTPANWIKQTKEGRLDLELGNKNDKPFIIDCLHNWSLMKTLKSKGNRYISTKSKQISASKDLSKIFTKKALSQLFSSLSSRNEIPYKYTYFSEGADLWDDHYNYSHDGGNSFVKNDADLILDKLAMLIESFKDYRKVNIFDIGCGNGKPALPLLDMLSQQKFGITYTALDISPKMLDIAEKNIHTKFPDLAFDKMAVDFDTFNISDLLYFADEHDTQSVNIVLYLGGTLGNQSDVTRIYANLRDSMSEKDFLIISTGLYKGRPKKNKSRTNQYHLGRTLWIPDLLGLKDHYNENDIFDEYDIHTNMFRRCLTLLEDVEIDINIDGLESKISFERGETILIFKYQAYTLTELIDQLDQRGFLSHQSFTNLEGTNVLIVAIPKKY